MNCSGVDNNHSQIGQSIAKCKEDILSILNRLKNFYDPCDLDTVRGFSKSLNQSLNKVFENFLGDLEQSSNDFNSPSCKTNETDPNTGKIITVKNPLNDSALLATTETPAPCSTQKKEKKKFVEILEDVRIQPSSVLEQFINSSCDVERNQRIAQFRGRNIMFEFEEESFAENDQYFGDHIEEIGSRNDIDVFLQNDREQSPERFQEIISKVKARASPVLKKANDQCEICRKKLPGEIFLIYHRRVHLAEYPVHCYKCFEIFFKFTEKDHHEESCQKIRYECYRCGETLLNLLALEQHMQRH